MGNDSIHLRPLLPADIPFAQQLKTRIGWNQLEADWATLLALSRGGSYLALYDDQQVGTVTTIQYDGGQAGETFSWIGMVLVDPAVRGRGIGTRLLRAAIDYACATGAVLLDATPQGRKLYLTLGFTDICGLERLEIRRLPELTDGKTTSAIHALSTALLPKVVAYDARHFGAARKGLLTAFWRHAPECAFVATCHGRLTGYCLGRHGSDFEQIGPLMAEDLPTARRLFSCAAAACRGRPVIVDVMQEQSDWRSHLLDLGFDVQRPFTRMCRGAWGAPADRSAQFAIAGPEFG